MELNYIDLFSGIGGFHLGLLQAGFKFEKCYHSEINKYAKSVYQKQFPGSKDLGDVTKINVSGFPEGKYIVSAGWPCQDNSIAGKRKGQSRGLRSSLFSEVVRILSGLVQMGSEVIFIGENVKGLYSVNEGMDFYNTITRLTNLDTDMPQLTLEVQLCNTRWFLPQNRERIYFVGYTGNGSGRKIFPIEETSFQNGEGYKNKIQQIAQCLRSRDVVNWKGNMIKIKPILTSDRKQKRQYKVGNKEKSIRHLTPIECARLQGFPDLWCNILSDTQVYKCYGNSVSVSVIKIIASRIKEIFI